MSVPLFVYGTLKKGFPLHSFLAEQKFLGAALLKGFRMLDLGAYPGVVRDEKAGTIKGELYSVDEVLLRRLDYIEGAYTRQLHVTTEGIWVNVYVWNGSRDFDLIPDGDWR